MTQGLDPIPTIALPESRLTQWHLTILLGETSHELDSGALLHAPAAAMRSTLHAVPLPRRLYTIQLEIPLDPAHPAVRKLEDWLLLNPQRPQVTLAFGDPEQVSWSGHAERLIFESGHARLYVRGGYPNAARSACRTVREAVPAGKRVPAGFLPQVFGRAWLRPVPLFTPQTTNLAEDLGTEAKEAFLQDIQDWPPAGTVQINDEVLEYETIDKPTGRIGSQAQPLLRYEPRAHRSGTAALLLPTGPLRWCAADHPADVLQLRFPGSHQPVGPEVAPVTEDLAGRPATILIAAQLPLERRHATTAQPADSGTRWQDWQIEPDTTAADPIDAFAVTDPGRGAVLSAGFPRLRASYIATQPPQEHRFDRVLSTRLRLEFSETPHWGGDTRLYVRIRKGSWEKEVHLNRIGTVFPAGIEGDAVKEEIQKDQPAPVPVRHRFEDVTAHGSWTMPEAAINGRYVPAATADAASAAASLELRFRRAPLPGPGQLEGASLRAAVHNPDQQPCTVKLRADLSGAPPLEEEFTIAAEDAVTLVLPLEDQQGVPLPGWDALSSVYTVELQDGGGTLHVKEAWLQTTWQEEHPGLPEEEVRLPLEATVGMRLEYPPVALELDGIPGYDSWEEFFGAPYPEITVELLDPPDIPFWAVYLRAVRWEWDALPATSVRPSADFEALVHGRRTKEDGIVKPSEAVHELLTAPEFGNVPSAGIDEESFASAGSLAGQRGFRVAAVVQGRETVGTLLERLLAETCQVLAHGPQGWTLRPVPLRMEDALPPLLPPAEVIHTPGRRELAPAEPQDIAVAEQATKLPDNGETQAPASSPRNGLLWLYTGAQLLRRHLLDRLLPGRSVHTAALDASLLALTPGRTVVYPAPDGSVYQGELHSLELADGRIAAELVRCQRRETAFASGAGHIAWNPRSGALRFFIDGKLLAVLELDGDLLLAGGAIVEPVTPLAGAGPVAYDAQQNALFFVEPEASTTARLGADGTLTTPVQIQEEQALEPKSLPDNPIRPDGEKLLFGGLPDAPPLATLSQYWLRLKGNVYTDVQLD